MRERGERETYSCAVVTEFPVFVEYLLPTQGTRMATDRERGTL